MGVEKGEVVVKLPKCPPTPPPPPRPRWGSSYTRREIEKFWRKKRLVEQEHFLAAIKAAARLRATHFSEKDYMIFLEGLKENQGMKDDVIIITTQKKGFGNNQEIRVGIKDWWTKSKYAYLNQPAIGSVGRPNRRFNYKPESIWFHKMPSSIATASA